MMQKNRFLSIFLALRTVSPVLFFQNNFHYFWIESLEILSHTSVMVFSRKCSGIFQEHP